MPKNDMLQVLKIQYQYILQAFLKIFHNSFSAGGKPLLNCLCCLEYSCRGYLQQLVTVRYCIVCPPHVQQSSMLWQNILNSLHSLQRRSLRLICYGNCITTTNHYIETKLFNWMFSHQCLITTLYCKYFYSQLDVYESHWIRITQNC